jgi:hypothetical protein
MSRKEVPWPGLLKAALAGTFTNAEGAGALHLSVRQFIRVKHRFRADGAPGLCHLSFAKTPSGGPEIDFSAGRRGSRTTSR